VRCDGEGTSERDPTASKQFPSTTDLDQGRPGGQGKRACVDDEMIAYFSSQTAYIHIKYPVGCDYLMGSVEFWQV
jgi:hypothetical protein